MFPMKFFEYLAAGVPVVATQLPALQAFRHLAAFTEGGNAFLAAVDATLSRCASLPAGAEMVPLAQLPECCTYQARTSAMLKQLQQLLPST
jgi:hypothetical protein